jgi:hypothetical protein
VTQYYVNFNEVGNIIGFYVDDIHGEDIPETAKTITADEWQTLSADANRYKLDGEDVRLKTQIELDAEYAEQPAPEKTPEQLEIISLKARLLSTDAELSAANSAIIEIWEAILG